VSVPTQAHVHTHEHAWVGLQFCTSANTIGICESQACRGSKRMGPPSLAVHISFLCTKPSGAVILAVYRDPCRCWPPSATTPALLINPLFLRHVPISVALSSSLRHSCSPIPAALSSSHPCGTPAHQSLRQFPLPCGTPAHQSLRHSCSPILSAHGTDATFDNIDVVMAALQRSVWPFP